MDAQFLQASPIVVIGMHRSGTRLLVDVLDKLGVFMGADRQADSESVTFMLLNESVLHQCGAFWSEPMSAHFMLAQPDVAEHVAVSTRDALAAQLENYAGSSAWGRSLKSVPSSAGARKNRSAPSVAPTELPAFGWKDPRNTFTLPVWTRIFPNLRVIHIVRHGVDAAASLARRHAAALRAATGEAVPPALAVIRDHALGILSSRRGWTLAEALTMWEQYVEKGREQCAALGERALELRYEELLLQPERAISAVAKFCRVPEPAQRAALLDGLETGRAFAFRHEPGLVAFAESARDVLARYGYEP